MIDFEKKVKSLLELKGFTQEILADKIGITRRTLQNYFTKNAIDSDILEKISNVLGCNVGYFFNESEPRIINTNWEKEIDELKRKIIDMQMDFYKHQIYVLEQYKTLSDKYTAELLKKYTC